MKFYIAFLTFRPMGDSAGPGPLRLRIRGSAACDEIVSPLPGLEEIFGNGSQCSAAPKSGPLHTGLTTAAPPGLVLRRIGHFQL